MVSRFILCLALLTACPFACGTAALAEGLQKNLGGPRFFDPATGGSLCYLRRYSVDHLNQHPDQRVAAMGLALMPEVRDQTILILYVRVRSSVETAVAAAYCAAQVDGLDCQLTGDAGQFSLTAARNGALRLTVAARGISFEGRRDFITLKGTTGDDRVFLLPPLGAEPCARLTVAGELN